MGRNKRVAVAGLAAAAIAAVVSVFAVGPTHSAAGSCVTAKIPSLSSRALYYSASHACSGSGKMYVFVEGRYGKQSHVYTIASGTATGTVFRSSAPHRCAATGTWHVWTFAFRGGKTNSSSVLSYSCRTSHPSVKLVQ